MREGRNETGIYLNIFKLFMLVLSSTHVVKAYWEENCFLCVALKVGRQRFEVVPFFQLKEMYLY